MLLHNVWIIPNDTTTPAYNPINHAQAGKAVVLVRKVWNEADRCRSVGMGCAVLLCWT